MTPPTDDVMNWMNMFRWIVKLIRDDFGIEEARLVRHAQLETELGLSLEQVEQVLEAVADAFRIRFPEEVLKELERRGHIIERWPEFTREAAAVEAIHLDASTGFLRAGADPRQPAYAITA